MTETDDSDRPAGTTDQPALPRGLLGMPGQLPFRVAQQPPGEDLCWLVDRFWSSAWDVPTGRRVTARVLPHPNVNLTVEGPSGQDVLILTGIAPGVFTRTLAGHGDVLGVKFTVGAFRLVSDTPVQQLSSSGAPGTQLLPDGGQLEQRLRAADRREQVELIETYLRSLDLAPTEELVVVQRATTALITDPEVNRVGVAAGREGVSERTLQRLFAHWVGVSPGWVLRRGRLHAAAERLILLGAVQSNDPGSRRTALADLAADFGYVDQAHFTNDFRRILGEPPAAWAANLISESSS